MANPFTVKDSVLRSRTVRALAEKAAREAEERGVPVEQYLKGLSDPPGTSHGLADEVAAEAKRIGGRAGSAVGDDVASSIAAGQKRLAGRPDAPRLPAPNQLAMRGTSELAGQTIDAEVLPAVRSAPGPLASIQQLYNGLPASAVRPAATPIPPSASANSATPTQLDSLASKLKKGAAVAGVGGAALYADSLSEPNAEGATDPVDETYTTSGGGGGAEDTGSTLGGDTEQPSKNSNPPANPYTSLVEKAGKGLYTANTEEKVDRALEKLGEVADRLPPEKQAEFDRQLADIGHQKDRLAEQYREDRRKVDWMQVGDILGRALVKLGAAAQGLKSNVDLSKVDIPALDLEPQRKAAREDLSLGLDRAGEREKRIREMEARDLESVKSQNADRRFGIKTQLDSDLRRETDKEKDSREQLQSLERLQADFQGAVSRDERNFEQQKELTGLQQAGALERAQVSAATKAGRKDDTAQARKDKAAAEAGAILRNLESDIYKRKDLAKVSKDLQSRLSMIYGEAAVDGAFRGVDPTDQPELAAAARKLAEGSPQAAPTATGPRKKDPTVEQYAETNKLDYNRARQILVNRGYQPNE